MEQKKILIKSYDVQPFLNKDEYIDVQLNSSVKEIKQDYLSNDFDLTQQYNSERNASRKFFVYGRLYAKQTDTSDLIITLRTSDNDVLYVPNKKNNILPPNTKSVSIVTKSLTKNVSFSRNIFGNIEAPYYFQFEIDGSNSDSGTTKNAILSVSGNQIDNEISVVLIYYDSDGNFVPYGTIDTVFDSNFNIIQINNDYPFLYDCHWVKENIDVVTFNNVYFPFKQFQDNLGNTIIDNSTQITDANLNPSFQLLMDYPSFYGLEEATLSVTKTVKPRNDYFVPTQFFDATIFEKYSPWEGAPQNQYQWNIVGGAIENVRNVIINNQSSYPNFVTFNTSQQFYDANVGFFLSYFEGSNLNAQNTEALSDSLIISGFLDYSSSIYKKDVSVTQVGEFISGFTVDTGQVIDKIKVDFSQGNSNASYNVQLSAVTFYNEMDYLVVNIDSTKDLNVGTPSSYFINVIAENKKPTASFFKGFDSTQAENIDYELVVNLDKPYEGTNPVVLTISTIANKTTAISLDQAIAENPGYPFTVNFSTNGETKHDYEILVDSGTLINGSTSVTFKIRIYYSSEYFINKTLGLQLSASTGNVLIDPLNSQFVLDINSVVVPGWTKYQFPADNIIGIGMFRSNRPTAGYNALFNFETESPINNTDTRLNFTPSFTYTIACFNAGDTQIAYGGDYGGSQKNVAPGDVVFQVDSTQDFEQFDFVLPSNSNLIQIVNPDNSITAKYSNSKYEFRIQNIQAINLNDPSGASSFNDVHIPAQNAYAFRVATSNNYNQWKKYISSIDFFDGLLTTIDSTQITSDYPDSGSLSSVVDGINKSVFILKTGIENVYIPESMNRNVFPITQLINPNNQGTILSNNINMFGTIFLNSTINGSATNVSYRGFTNDRINKNLLVPSQTSINFVQSDSDAGYLLKFVNYYHTIDLLTYTTNQQYHPGLLFTLTALKEINFSNQLPIGTNSYDDSIPGIKPLPVYEYVPYNQLLIS